MACASCLVTHGGTRRGSRWRRSTPTSCPPTRLASWYRRFIDTRSSDAAERVLATALAGGVDLAEIERVMTAAITDHVFVDGGHTLDFTNKAFEALEHLGVRVGRRDPADPGRPDGALLARDGLGG